MPSINCTEFNDLLLEAVESHRPVDTPALRDHAVGCGAAGRRGSMPCCWMVRLPSGERRR